MSDEITICSKHQDYQVPLIWTFAFRGCEWWCPYCGEMGGMFGTGQKVSSTNRLLDLRSWYKKSSTAFLIAMGSRDKTSMREIDGKMFYPDEFPQDVKDSDANAIKKWEYGQKPSDEKEQK